MVEGLGEILVNAVLVLDNSDNQSSFFSKVLKDPQNATFLQYISSMNVPLSLSRASQNSTGETWPRKE